MMSEEQLQQQRPHPMPHLVLGIPIPSKTPEEAEKASRRPQVQVGPFTLAEPTDPDDMIVSAIVLEIGEPHDEEVPYMIGATVYYFKDQALTVNGYALIPMNRVVGWSEAS